MANYFEMSKDQLRAEKAALEQSYAEFKAKGLKLNMARGKPGPSSDGPGHGSAENE